MKMPVFKNISHILCLFISIYFGYGQIYADELQQSSPKPLQEILTRLSISESINFIYNDVLVEGKKVKFNFNVQNVDSAINVLLAKYNITYKMVNENTYVLYQKPKVEKTHTATKMYEARIEVKKAPVLKPPKIIKSYKIPYPELAQQKGIEGTVEIQMLINEKGNVVRTRINQSSSFDILDRAALEYTKKIKFRPAQIDSQTVSIWTRWKIIFELIPSDTTFPEVVLRKIDQ